MSEDYVFCRIVAGTLPSYRLCEDDRDAIAALAERLKARLA